ncbi:MAG: hypothetical protein KDC05_08335 [Bacteroidales bacterium]|nr:hypothetical protein [Bacteroidales bacterium]
MERISIGGGLGLSFSDYSTLVDVSPVIGYSVSDDFMVGIGLTYKYYRYKDYYRRLSDRELFDYKTNMYGMSVWSRYFLTKSEIPVIENMFLHAEIEPLLFTTDYALAPQGEYDDIFGNRYNKQNQQQTLTGVFLGGGLMQPVGGRSYMYIEALWNFNEDLYSPYSNPRIRIGVSVGL